MRSLIVAVPLFLLAGCVAPSAPAPPPAPMPPKAPPPPVPVAPTSTDWRDWPLTPGDWVYDRGSRSAGFGQPGRRFVVECLPDKKVRLFLPAGAPGSITIRTSSTTRSLMVEVVGHPIMGSAAVLLANDPLLDAMGFSRGRFIVQSPNSPPLVIPAWPEILRVVEDCRG